MFQLNQAGTALTLEEGTGGKELECLNIQVLLFLLHVILLILLLFLLLLLLFLLLLPYVPPPPFSC